jgi:hypothetical protein
MIDDHISNHQVRRTLLRGLPSAGFASHTMNEAYVGGRWRRLNYRTLGQNSYGAGAMGMLTHILTFRDLSEAGLTKTWGWRYGRGARDDTFPGSNPYRLIEISDRFGIHSQLENTPVVEPEVATISKAYWFFSDQRPAWIRADSRDHLTADRRAHRARLVRLPAAPRHRTLCPGAGAPTDHRWPHG